MTSSPKPDKLLECVGDMVALERQIEKALGQLGEDVAAHPEAAEAIRRFQDTTRGQLEALRARLDTIGGREPDSPRTIVPLPFAPAVWARHEGHLGSVSRKLHTLCTAFNHAALGYAVLHAVAHRFYDSQEEGNTADLAEQHLRGYAAAVQEINQLISDVAVWELGGDGHECECLCPSCGLGVCVCSPHGTNTVNQVWRETSPAAPEGGLRVRRPRRDSAAASAGMREDDIIIAVDDQQIGSDLDTQTMQAGVRKHQSGEKIRFRVRCGKGEQREITVIRP